MNRRSFLLTTPAAAGLIAAGVAQAKTPEGDAEAIEVTYLGDALADAEARGDRLLTNYLNALVHEDLLAALPFLTVEGGALDRKGERFTTITPREQDVLKIACGDLDVDATLVTSTGPGMIDLQQRMWSRKHAQALVDRFVNGDGTARYAYGYGLKHRIAEEAVIDMGGSLQISVMDRAIEQTGATHVLMSKRMRNLLSAAGLANPDRAWIQWDKDEYATRVANYTTRKGRKVRILCTDYNDMDEQIIGFDEPGETTSVYVLAIKPDGVAGLLNTLPTVFDLGLISKETTPFHPDADKNVYRTRTEWLTEPSILANHVAIRLSGIRKAAPVA